MSDRFQACLAETLKWEGGYSNDAHDPGGPTMHGIIQREYNSYRQHKGLAQRSVRQITTQEEQEIYRASYWAAVRGDELPAGVDLVMFDFAVNSGPGRAIQKAQKSLGLAIDGHLGASTMAAVCACDGVEFVSKLMDTRLAYLKSLSTWRYFGKGWGDRCKGVRGTALLMAKDHPVTILPDVPMPKADPENQAASLGKTPREDPKPFDPKVVVGATASIAAPIAGALGTPAAAPSSLPIPAAPDSSMISGWQTFAQAIHDVFGFCAEHWPFAIGAAGIFVFLTYGLPALHKRFA